MKMRFKSVACLPEEEPTITLSADPSTWKDIVALIKDIWDREGPDVIIYTSRSERYLEQAIYFLNDKLLEGSNGRNLTLDLPLSVYQTVALSIRGYQHNDYYLNKNPAISTKKMGILYSSLDDIIKEVQPILFPTNKGLTNDL